MGKINVSSIVADIQKLYPKDKKVRTIISSGDAVKSVYSLDDCAPYPEGSPLYELSGLPGIPYNKIVEVAGPPDTGKSTLSGEIMAEAQRKGVQVILWDSEQKFDSNRFAAQFGGKPQDLLLVKTNETRYGGEIVRKYINAVKEQDPNAKMLVVWDSVGGSQSRSHAEFELDSDKSAQPGQDAKENGMVMKMLVALINKHPDSIAVYLANQVYAKIGFMQSGDAAAGGKKVEFHSSLIVFLKRIKTVVRQVKGKKVKEGIITRATVTKNHLTQGTNSVYQLDFSITAAGSRLLTEQVSDDDSED